MSGILQRYRRIIVFDTETTGIMRYDKLVSLGAVSIEDGKLVSNRALHLIFDPRKDSHPRALDVHGWDDWTLRHQDLFASLAPGIHRWLSWADLLVCHNAEFDMHYLQREFRKAGHDQLIKASFCTMKEARARWPGEPAGLDELLEKIGRARQGRLHGALEDAILTAALFMYMQKGQADVPSFSRLPGPSNLKPCPAPPSGAAPRRSAKKPLPWPPIT
jgi:DNA polymerase III subunit epsilon